MRYTCLDGLRGVLATYVMVSHMAPFAFCPPALAWLPPLVAHGGACVDVFFILSGLVIAQSLASSGGRPWPFLAARARRLMPTFYAAFALAVPVALLPPVWDAMPWIAPDGTAHHLFADSWPEHGGAEIAAHLAMVHGLIPRGILPYAWVDFLGSAWSLSTEWQFYVLMAAGLRRTGAYLALAAAGLLYAWHAPEAWQFSRAFLPNKAAYFALGLASLPVLRGAPGARTRYAATLLACAAIAFADGDPGKILPPLLWTACLAAQLRPRSLAARTLSHPALLWLGAISYPLYLVNEPIQRIVAQALAPAAGGDATAFTLAWIPLSLGLPVLVAKWLHDNVERPGQGLRWGFSPAGSSAPRA